MNLYISSTHDNRLWSFISWIWSNSRLLKVWVLWWILHNLRALSSGASTVVIRFVYQYSVLYLLEHLAELYFFTFVDVVCYNLLWPMKCEHKWTVLKLSTEVLGASFFFTVFPFFSVSITISVSSAWVLQWRQQT